MKNFSFPYDGRNIQLEYGIYDVEREGDAGHRDTFILLPSTCMKWKQGNDVFHAGAIDIEIRHEHQTLFIVWKNGVFNSYQEFISLYLGGTE